MNLNTRYSYLQFVGMKLFQAAGEDLGLDGECLWEVDGHGYVEVHGAAPNVADGQDPLLR